MFKLKIILASTREGRQGNNVAQWVLTQATLYPGFETELLDLRDYQLPYYEDPVPAGMLQPPYSPAIRQRWAEKIDEADAILIVTPEYNHSFPAVLKSALDAVYKEWNNKPVAFVSYGGFANGSRSVEQLRQIVIELQMAPIREAVHVGLFTGEKLFDESGAMLIEAHTKKLQSVFEQLLWWTDALATARHKERGTTPAVAA